MSYSKNDNWLDMDTNTAKPFSYVVDGDVIETFEELWQAQQYMDEDLDKCKQLAVDVGSPMSRSVVEQDGYVHQKDVVRPERRKFVREDRSQLESLQSEVRAAFDVLAESANGTTSREALVDYINTLRKKFA